MDLATLLQLLDSSVRLATPLLLACLAGLFSERAGIFDIGLEGKILVSAFFSAAIAAFTGNVWLGLLAGIGASLVFSLLHGVASITFRGNQLISGVALNFLASGMTVVIGEAWFALGGRTPQLTGDGRFHNITLPFAEQVQGVPILGPIYHDLISGHSILVYVAFLVVPLTWWVLFRTRFGLRLRAVGENPAAVDTAGISVVGMRFAAVMICGVLCGIAGAYLATGLSASFVREMSAGRGFIALAALIFSKWRPWYALMACLLFGLLDATGSLFQNIQAPSLIILALLLSIAAVLIWVARRSVLDMAIMGTIAFALVVGSAGIVSTVDAVSVLGRIALPTVAVLALAAVAAGMARKSVVLTAYVGFGAVAFVSLAALLAAVSGTLGTTAIPVQFMQALPYILTVVILAGFVGKAIPPRAGGAPYVKEQ